jgi:S-disulfanyl-L-cysteine oxidoreductase SoxD
MIRRFAFLLIPALAPGLVIALLFNTNTHAQAPAAGEHKNIWTGVYTAAEASRGQAIYQEFCTACHGMNLGGDPSSGGPPLEGDKFWENWREDTVENLFLKIRNTMPRRGFRGSDKILTDRESLDLVAFIFQKNNLPAGSELSPSSIGDVWIELKEGSKPLPNYSQLQVIGCMEQEAENWVLAKAGQPTRLRASGETIEPAVLQAAQAKPLGDRKFRLQNLIMLGSFNAEAHKGHKMIAQGVLVRQGGSDRISVTKLEMLSAQCGQ